MATSLIEQVRDSMAAAHSGLAKGGAYLAGLLAGLIGLVLSFALKGLVPARPLGDPLPLVLSLTQLTRGFVYFQWQPALFHLLFAVTLGLLAFFLLWFMDRGAATLQRAKLAGRIAAILNVGVVALLAVDTIIVGFWYLMSGLVSVIISGFVAGRAASWWSKRRSHLQE